MKVKKLSVKNLLIPCLFLSTTLFSGCATIMSGSHQDVKVTSDDPALNSKLKLVANTDKNRVIKYPTANGEMDLHRTNQAIEIKIEETECIQASSETFDSYVNGYVFMDFLMGSLLSTLVDSSTGAAWAYDETMIVHPKIKPTEDCQKWLKELQEKYKAEYATSSEKN